MAVIIDIHINIVFKYLKELDEKNSGGNSSLPQIFAFTVRK